MGHAREWRDRACPEARDEPPTDSRRQDHTHRCNTTRSRLPPSVRSAPGFRFLTRRDGSDPECMGCSGPCGVGGCPACLRSGVRRQLSSGSDGSHQVAFEPTHFRSRRSTSCSLFNRSIVRLYLSGNWEVTSCVVRNRSSVFRKTASISSSLTRDVCGAIRDMGVFEGRYNPHEAGGSRVLSIPHQGHQPNSCPCPGSSKPAILCPKHLMDTSRSDRRTRGPGTGSRVNVSGSGGYSGSGGV